MTQSPLKVAMLVPALGAQAGGIEPIVSAIGERLRLSAAAEVKLFAPTRGKGLTAAVGGGSRAIMKSVREFSPSLVHTHGLWIGHSRAGAKLARVHGIPEVISPQGMLDHWALSHRAWKKRLVWSLIERDHLRGCSALHAVAEVERRSFRGLGLKGPIAVIPNGVNLPHKRSEEPPIWRERFGEGARVLLFLGRMHPKKGVESLIRAWKEVAGEAEPEGWRLALVGWDDGGHAEGYVRLIDELGLSGSCTWFGPAFGEAKAAALAEASAFILPSFSEGMPVAVLEAWASKLPVLMTPECNLPEGFAAGAALPISTEVPALTAQLREFLLMKPSAREAMGAAGLALVKERFTWQKVTAQYLELYRWILGGGTAPAFVSTT